MELLRDLVRDLVGIIFPGAFLILLTIWLLWATMILLGSSELLTTFLTGRSFYTFSILLIFSYIAGQSLRLKQLKDVETNFTKYYRNKREADFRKEKQQAVSESEFENSSENLDQLEEEYSTDPSKLQALKKAYEEHNARFGIWEEFPYRYQLRGKRLLEQTPEYNKFFDKYEANGMTKKATLFHFFKSAIYEYSPSFKEELIRQESLVRLLSGIYYATKFGAIANIFVGSCHLVAILLSHLVISDLFHHSVPESRSIILIAAIGLMSFRYLNREIVNRLRFMRVKELMLAFDGFYLICKRYKLDFSA